MEFGKLQLKMRSSFVGFHLLRFKIFEFDVISDVLYKDFGRVLILNYNYRFMKIIFIK